MTRPAQPLTIDGMAEGFSSHDVPADDRAVLHTIDELAGFLRASTEAPKDPESDDAQREKTDEEVLQ